MAKKLNIPLIGTFIIDYLLVYFTFYSFLFYYFANNLNQLNNFIIHVVIIAVLLQHDPIHSLIMISKAKLNYKYSMKEIKKIGY